MRNVLFLLLSVLMISSLGHAYSQEPSLATFQETAQVIVDKTISGNVSASVTLQSTSIQEIKIPAELESKIRDDDRVRSIVLTNHDQCVFGVVDQACIMINVQRDPDAKGIIEIQDAAKEIGEQYIDDVNKAFDTSAEMHSVFVHADDEVNRVLETSGAVSGRGMVSVVYTLPMEDTGSMYEKISTMLIPKMIRDAGGFYNVASSLSHEENAKMTFSLIPLDSKSLLQIKLSVDYKDRAEEISQISPMEFLKTTEIARSDYFSGGFYPLNSVIQVVVLSPEETSISDIQGNVLDTQTVDEEKIPTKLTENGWVFDPQQGEKIQGMYIFGENAKVGQNELVFTLGKQDTQTPPPPEEEKRDSDEAESMIIVTIIAIVAIGAALYYLKGYRK